MWQESILYLLDKFQVSKAWSYYKQLLLTEFKTGQELSRIQWEKFKIIIRYAYENISFYRNKFDQAGIHPRDIIEYSDIRKIPVLSRNELEELEDSLRESGSLTNNNMFMESSGTTQNPVRVNISKDAVDYRYALLLRHLNRSGWKFGQRIAKFITPQEYYQIESLSHAFKLIGNTVGSIIRKGKIEDNDVFRFIYNKIIYEAMHGMKMIIYEEPHTSFSKNNINNYLQILERHNPELVIARPDFLFLLAKGIDKFAIKAPSVSTVIVMGNLLTDEMANVIKDTFGCSLFDIYGSSELSYVAGSCPKAHNVMHINSEAHLVEILPLNESQTEQCEQGRLVVSDLSNYACPLIRYCPGDLGELLKDGCNCGRNLPMVKIYGREQVIIFDKNDKLITEAQLIKLINEIIGDIAFKLLYNKNGRAKVHIDADINPEQLEQWEHEFRSNDLGFEIEFVKSSKIFAEKSGKFRFISSGSEK